MITAKKHNILYLHEARVFGGAEISLLALIKGLDRDRFLPIVACPPKSEFADKLGELGVRLCPIEYPGLKNILATLVTIRSIKNIARRESVSLIHANSPRTNLMGAIAAKFAGIPIIWHERTLLEGGMVDINRIFATLSDRIICNSEAIRKRWLKKRKFADKTLAILNGVDLARFNPNISGQSIRGGLKLNSDTYVVGIISRLWPDKGHRDFITAASKVLKGIPDVCFIVVGDYSLPEYAGLKRELDELIVSLGIKDKLMFVGFRSDIPQVIAGVDIVVLPSEVEGCSRVLLEAMAMGKPVVATNLGGTPEIVDDGITGIMIPPNDPASLANALTKLLNDKELSMKMGRCGRIKAAESFSVEKNVAKTMAVYEEVLNYAE